MRPLVLTRRTLNPNVRHCFSKSFIHLSARLCTHDASASWVRDSKSVEPTKNNGMADAIPLFLAGAEGLEPTTPSFGDWCSTD